MHQGITDSLVESTTELGSRRTIAFPQRTHLPKLAGSEAGPTLVDDFNQLERNGFVGLS